MNAACRCVLDGELLVWDVEVGMFKARTRTLNSDAGTPLSTFAQCIVKHNAFIILPFIV